LKEIGGWRQPLGEKVDVVGHYAVGVDCNAVCEGLAAEMGEEPLRAGSMEEDLFAVVAAEGQEEPSGADVAVEREADGFVVEHV